MEDRVWAVWGAALGGDFAPLEAERERIASERTPFAEAWSLALSAARWQAMPTSEGAPDPARLAEARITDETALPIALACSVGELVSFCAFDAESLARFLSAHERVPATDRTRPLLDCGRALSALARGEREGLAASARELEGRAAAAGLAHVVIDAASVAALAALGAGDLEAATSIARRASRMARTEALPQHEYFAHLVLARVRRHTGRPHHATRILTALARVAPAPWQGWLGWELLLAGGDPLAPHAPVREDVSQSATRELGRLLGAAGSGDRAMLAAAARAIGTALGGFAGIDREIDDLVVALDVDSSADGAPADLCAWLAGASDELPPHLLGAATLGRRESAAWVAAFPDPFVARRLLPLGVALLPPDSCPLASGARPGRTEHALAVLLHAGPDGLDNAALFRAVYGFSWNPVLHRSVLDVLLHRVRALAGDRATVTHQNERVSLTLHGAVHVPDPRCERPVDDRLLRALATRAGTARETAEHLGLPLRTVQTALKHLVDDGACVIEKRGRRVEYRVEDTTFSEPTLAG